MFLVHMMWDLWLSGSSAKHAGFMVVHPRRSQRVLCQEGTPCDIILHCHYLKFLNFWTRSPRFLFFHRSHTSCSQFHCQPSHSGLGLKEQPVPGWSVVPRAEGRDCGWKTIRCLCQGLACDHFLQVRQVTWPSPKSQMWGTVLHPQEITYHSSLILLRSLSFSGSDKFHSYISIILSRASVLDLIG